MKKKIIIAVIIILVAGSAFGYFLIRGSENTESEFRTAPITVGDVENTISSTGTLSPVTTVQIGTQVSGTIAEVFVDFNDKVKKGELLAVLDTVMLKASVLDARAGVEKAEAQLEQAQVEYDQNKKLYDSKLISEADFLPYSINLKTQQANVKSANATLKRAEQNLKYAFITSPINGTVIERNVEAGQTVAASLSTPTLFIIAEDLSRMEILAAVDESDIGQIKAGQSVTFTVQAYPDKTFDGVVTQVRLQPTTVSNVVTYTVVVSANNKDNLLLPGMTATVNFIIAQSKNVMLVPNSALRFQPSEKILAEYFKNQRQTHAENSNTGSTNPRHASGGAGSFSGESGETGASGSPRSERGRLWYLNDKGALEMERVETGITDGSKTEILAGNDLKPGMEVIIGMGSNSQGNTTERRTNGLLGGMRPRRF